MEALSLGLACTEYSLASDPDANFTEIASAEPINLPDLDALPSSPGKQLAEAWLQVLVDLQPLATSLNRYEGAKAAGSTVWMIRQLQAAQGLQSNLMSDLSIVRTLTDTFINSPEAQSLNLTTNDLAAFQATLTSSGLPQIEKDVLMQLGFTTADIADITNTTIGVAPLLPLNWRDAIVSGTDSVIKGFSLCLGVSVVTPVSRSAVASIRIAYPGWRRRPALLLLCMGGR